MCFTDNKRHKTERRQRHEGPPFGMADRRRQEDRRQTSIEEISLDEWLQHLPAYAKAKFTAGESLTPVYEEANDVFDRVSRH